MKIVSSYHTYEIKIGDCIDYIEKNYKEGDLVIYDLNIPFQLGNVIKYGIVSSEKEKEFTELFKIIKFMSDNNFKKNNKIFAFGGGVVQDICGFISSIYHRGLDWIFIPSTLISQGDSCIGGKTSINFNKYKNQLGNIYPPKEICIDINLLKTLPQEHINSGLGEMLHYFIFSSKKDFLFFNENMENKNYLSLIQKSLEIKKSVIEVDEKENGIRKLFNYGHTFGHAIESLSDYQIPHGVAVAMGMDLSNYISFRVGLLSKDVYLEIKKTINKITNKYNCDDVEKFYEIIKSDKKNSRSHIKPILCRGYGDLAQHSFTYYGELLTFIKEYFENE